jgi:hypothetical protein
MLRYDYDPNGNFAKNAMRKLAAKREADELLEQLQRQEDIRMILQAKPRPRTKDKFEQDLEVFTRNIQC